MSLYVDRNVYSSIGDTDILRAGLFRSLIKIDPRLTGKGTLIRDADVLRRSVRDANAFYSLAAIS